MSKESSSSSDSSDSDDRNKVRDKLKKIKKKIKKEERKAEKRLKKKLKKEKKRLKKAKKSKDKEKEKTLTVPDNPIDNINIVEKTSNIPLSLMEPSKAMKPMTKEEWEKRQAVVRKVLDEESGRYRLIKGDGEILEEIVPLKKHKEINKQATRADGEYFQAVLHPK